MRAGTSHGPFFLREWLPDGDEARNQALIGAIGASDPLQLDGLGGGSTLNSKVAIVSRSSRPDCHLDYLFAQVGVGHQPVDTRPNCGNMLSGVVPFAIEQGLIAAQHGHTTARVFNVNTGAKIDVTVCTPQGRITYDGDARIDGVAGTAAPILLNFLDAWGAVTGKLFPTGNRIDRIDGIEATCIDAAMPLMIVRAGDLGLSGRERPTELDADAPLMARIEKLRLVAGERMGLGDVSNSVGPKPVLVSAGDSPLSITSRYFTPRRGHASHAVTGDIGVATAFALPGTVASGAPRAPGKHPLVVQHPSGQIDVEVEIDGDGPSAAITRAALVRTARKIFQGELTLPGYVFPPAASASGDETGTGTDAAQPFPSRDIHILVPTSAGGGNDTMARALGRKLGPLLGQTLAVDNRAGCNGSIACDYASAGDGTVPHVAAELFKLNSVTSMHGLVHAGAAPAIADTARGNSHVMFPSLFTAQTYLRSGKLRALAVAGPTRLAGLPHLPTLAEAGIAGVELAQWYALFAPAKTPVPVIARLNRTLNDVLREAEIVTRFGEDGTQVQTSTPTELAHLLREERSRWRQIMRRVDLRIETPMMD